MYHTTDTPGSQVDWSMAQHEAAAAALGYQVAFGMRLWTAPRPPATGDWAKGMEVGAETMVDRILIDTARAAARHAFAAMDEADAIATALAEAAEESRFAPRETLDFQTRKWTVTEAPDGGWPEGRA